LDQLGGPRLELEAKARRVARRAQRPGRVVDERALVQDPKQTRLEVGLSRVRIDQLRLALKRPGDRVDGEVAPRQVLFERGGLDLGERPRCRIGLGAGAGEVELPFPELCRGGQEPLVLEHFAAQAPSDRGRVSLDRHIEGNRGPVQHQVTHGAANQIQRRPGGGLAEAIQLRYRAGDCGRQISLDSP